MKKIAQNIISILSLSALLVTSTFVTPSYAEGLTTEMSTQQCLDTLMSQNIAMWSCTGSAVCMPNQIQGKAPENSSLEQTPLIDTIYAYLTSTAFSTNDNKPMTPAQAAGVMGNMEAESSLNPASIEVTERIDKGHGLVQWTFERWDGANGLQSFANKANKSWDDTEVQLDYLKWELENTEGGIFKDSQFATSTDPAVSAQRWRVVFERADETLAHDSRRIASALAVYEMFGGQAASCGNPDYIASGGIVTTGIELALQSPAANGTTDKSQARDTYQAAKPKYNPDPDWTDCGGFVATVLRASGVDPDYPSVYVPTQMQYVKDHPEKYIVNTTPKMEELQPGDIIYTDGHTLIYTGEEEYPAVDASLGDRVPSVRPLASVQWMLSEDAMTARLKQ